MLILPDSEGSGIKAGVIQSDSWRCGSNDPTTNANRALRVLVSTDRTNGTGVSRIRYIRFIL
ncbi:hypothetical protein GOALK_121_00020 [Gordonia alkanivorans NBRC 16433]|uniref:Uncharacterized protein n=1 Tax=Gordonia alkanivorans NBRC 16433 TaxID=1027371 RepID=F9W2Q1_9ACTN|nr:hypothetical protein GOALK_121_00020 [Gordonia alkanivorans NBRC 16433]